MLIMPNQTVYAMKPGKPCINTPLHYLMGRKMDCFITEIGFGNRELPYAVAMMVYAL